MLPSAWAAGLWTVGCAGGGTWKKVTPRQVSSKHGRSQGWTDDTLDGVKVMYAWFGSIIFSFLFLEWACFHSVLCLAAVQTPEPWSLVPYLVSWQVADSN